MQKEPIMESVSLVLLTIFGFLVMLGVIPLRKVWSSLVGLVLVIIFLPVFIGIIKAEVNSFFTENHSWWMYGVGFMATLVIIRIFLNYLFPGRR
jgi:hypothetical protein